MYSTTSSVTFGFGYLVMSFAMLVFSIIVVWKVFQKAGKPGWAAIIPIYNIVVLLQIVKLSPWLLLLALIPFVNFIALPILGIITNIRLAHSFGKGTGFAIGLIFLNIIFMAIIAFSDSQYQEEQ